MSSKPAATTPSMAEQLKTYGLNAEDARELRLEEIKDVTTIGKGIFRKLKVGTPGIRIPYFHPLTNEPLTAAPKWPALYRVRLLGELKWSTTSPGPVKDKPPPKYLNESGIGIGAYFPRNLRGGWKPIFDDTEKSVIITEGEFKAARACKAGFATVALGGVYNTHNNELGQQESLLTELLEMNWARRKVYICFDSDYRSNPNVGTALQRLAEILQSLGAICMLISIPEDANKVGLDDFINAEGREALEDLIDSAVYLGMSKELFKLNDRFVHSTSPSGVLDTVNHEVMNSSHFREGFTEETHINRVYNPKTATTVFSKVALGPAWLKWDLHRKVDKLVYDPTGNEDRRGLFEENGVRCYNTWPGWAIEPRKGNAKKFLDHIDYIFTGKPEKDKLWFLRWLAYPLQNPGAKMLASAVIVGVVQGTGKSSIGHIMERIYGPNYSEVTQAHLKQDFNDWASNKQFVMCDDITGWTKRQDADVFKNMITQKTIRINLKHIGGYAVRACISYLWTTNQPDALLLDDSDRRFFIHTIESGPRDENYYDGLYKWLDDEQGAAIIFDYLLNLEMGDFNPNHHAMETTSKVEMRESSRSELDAWVHNVIDMPDAYLKTGDLVHKQELFTIEKLFAIYKNEHPSTNVTTQIMGAAFARARALRVEQVRWTGGKSRPYALRNVKKWTKLQHDYAEVKAYLEKNW